MRDRGEDDFSADDEPIVVKYANTKTDSEMQQLQQIWGQKDLHLHHIARTWQALKLGLGGNLERNFPDL